jgi:hypothetical protein
MNIAIFQDVTTEENLFALEQAAETYENLYVEMDQPEQRKFVKDQAAHIIGILKKLDRVRIDKSRDYKIKVEDEAGLIKARLEAANKPFTLLIDEYKLVREKEIAKKKAREEVKQLALQIPLDHDDALLMNKMFDFERAEVERERLANETRIANEATEAERVNSAQAVIDAVNAEQAKHDATKRRELAAKTAREADTVNKAAKNNAAMACFMTAGLSAEDAKLAVKSIAANRIDNVVINY